MENSIDLSTSPFSIILQIQSPRNRAFLPDPIILTQPGLYNDTSTMKVQSIILAIVSLAAASSNGPARSGRRTAVLERRGDLCGPLDTPMCCQTDVSGVADLDCAGSELTFLHLPCAPRLYSIISVFSNNFSSHPYFTSSLPTTFAQHKDNEG